MRLKPARRVREDSATLALKALAFLAEDEARLARFLGLTGLAPQELALRAQEPALQAAVLDHLLSDESLLLVFTAGAGIDPEAIAPAQAELAAAGGREASQ